MATKNLQPIWKLMHKRSLNGYLPMLRSMTEACSLDIPKARSSHTGIWPPTFARCFGITRHRRLTGLGFRSASGGVFKTRRKLGHYLMPRTFDDRPRERSAHIARWLAQRTEADIVTGICERWVRDLADSGREPHSRHDLSGLPQELNLVTRLSETGLRAYSDALAWQINGGAGIEPAEALLIGHALAVASGRVHVAYGPRKLHWIGHLVWTIFAVLRARAVHPVPFGPHRLYPQFPFVKLGRVRHLIFL